MKYIRPDMLEDCVMGYGCVIINKIFQLYRGVQIHWGRKLEYTEKTNDLL